MLGSKKRKATTKAAITKIEITSTTRVDLFCLTRRAIMKIQNLVWWGIGICFEFSVGQANNLF